jgi:RNA polymerase sigma-70 factor (ECF subfamily)
MKSSKQDEFLALYEPLHDRFERFCRARVYGDMDFRDVMNDSLLVAYSKFELMNSRSSFLSFLFGIAVRTIGNQLQKKKTERFNEKVKHHDRQDLGSSPSEDADIHFLYNAISQLVDEQREAIILFELTGFRIKEIAEIQNTSEAAVKQRLKRGREKLAELLTYDATLQKGEMKDGKE